MGLSLWLAAGIVAFTIARIVPRGRTGHWAIELASSLIAAAALGFAATALDFGGLREPDWRAGLFVFFGSLAILGMTRLTITSRSGGPT